MATFGAAVTQILSEMKRTDTSITADTEQAVIRACEHYAAQRFHFNEGRGSFTASQTVYYPLSTLNFTDLMEVDTMSVIINGTRYPLQPKTFDELEYLDLGTETGYPTHYAIHGESIRLYPKPNAAYQVDVAYQKRLATLSASTDSNAFLTNALDLIVARVEKILWARKFGDFQKAQAMQQLEDDELAKLQAQTEKMISSGRISAG